MTRFVLLGGYSAGRMVGGLAPVLADAEQGVVRVHLSTSYDVEATEDWRRATIELPQSGD